MKFSSSIVLLLSAVSTASASLTISNKAAAAKVLRQARNLNDNNAADDTYLEKYSLKLVGCKAGEQITNPENGELEYGAAIFRLCPTDSGCSDTSACNSKYGDYVVGLETFVEQYFEDQKDNMNWDDKFDVDRYAKCEQYKVDNQDGDNQYANNAYYIGPACTTDEKDVRLAVFEDETCTTESEVAFEDLSNGWSLPFSSGGMVTTNCINCEDYNDNNEAEVRALCADLTEYASYKCEDKLEYYSANGQNSDGCDYIQSVMPVSKKSSKSKSGGKIFGWIVFAAVVVGLVAYVGWWRKKKASAASEGLNA